MVDYHPRHVPYLGDSVLNQWNPEITATVGAMSPEEIFKYYAKSIGIGGIAMAGIIGIIKSWGIIKSAVGLAAKEMGGKADAETNVKRTQRDLSMKIIAIGSIVTLILVTLFFHFDVMQGNLMHTVVVILLVAGISFLFTTVAANAIAIVGTNPVSGMTLMTLYPCIGSNGGGRPERSRRNGGSAGYGRCGLYGTVHGGRFHHRP